MPFNIFLITSCTQTKWIETGNKRKDIEMICIIFIHIILDSIPFTPPSLFTQAFDCRAMHTGPLIPAPPLLFSLQLIFLIISFWFILDHWAYACLFFFCYFYNPILPSYTLIFWYILLSFYLFYINCFN